MIELKRLTQYEETRLLEQEFSKRYPWHTQGNYYEKCLEENRDGSRITLMAYYNGMLAGCCHLLFQSKYPPFCNENIPEINDLNVFPEFRRKKIASTLFDELECLASKKSRYIGLGVGLYKDYGNAQRMYNSRGYIMDGKGLTYKNQVVQPGTTVRVDDDLLIYLVKELKIYSTEMTS